MRYFVPTLVFPTGEQVEFVEKFGGLPWGLPQERWPRCAECGEPLTHLFSLAHHSERLDLGRERRQVLVFQCNHDPGGCATWSTGSGANAVVFLEPEDSTHKLTPLPESSPEGEVTEVEIETWVTGWEVGEDEVDPANFEAYFDDTCLSELSQQEKDSVFEGTKLGSAPSWIQSASEGPDAPFRFVGQFDMFHSVEGKAPATEHKPLHYFSERDGRVWFDAANYGDAGQAYLFLIPDPEVPQGAFFWQCG